MNLLVRVGAVAAATAVAAWLVPGITVLGATTGEKLASLLVVAVVFGVVNAVVKPVVAFLTGCLILLTLGLFLLVVNAWMLMLSGWISQQVGLGIHVAGFWSALLGAAVISIVSGVLSGVFGGPTRAWQS